MDIKKTILSRYPNADLEYLDRYVEICSLPAISGQRHHVLPRKLWPNEINSDWNIIVNGIMIHPNKLRALVDEFNAHGFKLPVNTRGDS